MNQENLTALNNEIKEGSIFINEIKDNIKKVIIGQDKLIKNLILAILSDGHVFLEGVPGLAKTLLIKTLASIIDTKFQRIQFTPDLLPADIIGTLIYNQSELSFEIKKGPIFSNIILADEINRAPAKVQSALLEAMEERQVTIGDNTYKLDNPFFVMATQNPIEQEGTYALPEAQVDRFMFKLIVNYPSKDEEMLILEKMINIEPKKNELSKINLQNIFKARSLIDKIHLSDNIKKYIVSITHATRNPKEYNLNDISQLISIGVSPRATIYLGKAAKSNAFMENRSYVIPEDVRSISPEILRHRIVTTYEADAEEISTDDIIQRIFDAIPIP
jgi:MoxR-like ATPase